MSSLSGITPQPGKHDFYGAWNPTTGYRGHNETFSVAVFKWLDSQSGRLKRSACVIRVKGRVDSHERVYAKALELCQMLDAGKPVTQKSITV